MSIYSVFSCLSKDKEEQRNLFFFGLSMLLGTLAIPFYAGSVGQAFNAKYGITPTILAAMQLPTRIITIAVMLGSTAFIDRVKNRIAFNALIHMLTSISCFAALVKCLGPESFRTVAALVTIDIAFGLPACFFNGLRGGADAMVQCRIIHNEIRGRFWSIFGIIGGVAGILVGLLITWLLKQMEVRIVYVIVTIPGILLIVAAGLCGWMVRELPDLQNAAPPKKEPVLESIKNIVTMKQFRIMMPANFMRSMGDGCVSYALLLALQSWKTPLPQEYAGYIQTVTSAAPFLGYIILALSLDRFGPGIVLPVVDLLMGIAMFCMGSIQSGCWLIGSMAVYQVLLITESAAIPLAHYEVVPNEVMGAFNNVRLLLMNLTGMISGTLAGVALGFFPAPVVFAAGAIVKIAAGILYSYGIFTLRKHKESEAAPA